MDGCVGGGVGQVDLTVKMLFAVVMSPRSINHGPRQVYGGLRDVSLVLRSTSTLS